MQTWGYFLSGVTNLYTVICSICFILSPHSTFDLFCIQFMLVEKKNLKTKTQGLYLY